MVVLDAGGHQVVLKREDGSGILRPEIATAEAYGALGIGLSCREIGDRRPSSRSSSQRSALSAVAGGRLAPAAEESWGATWPAP